MTGNARGVGVVSSREERGIKCGGWECIISCPSGLNKGQRIFFYSANGVHLIMNIYVHVHMHVHCGSCGL